MSLILQGCIVYDSCTVLKPWPVAVLQGFHTVLSDMCHNTTGIPSADVALSLGLAREAARLALSEAGSSDCHSSGKLVGSMWPA